MPPAQRPRNPVKNRVPKKVVPPPRLTSAPTAKKPAKKAPSFARGPGPLPKGSGFGTTAFDSLLEGVGKPLVRLAADASPGTVGPKRLAAPPKRPKAEKEADLESLLGKSIVNLVLHGDTPKNWKEGAGLGIGLAGVLPIGRLGKTAAAITKASTAAKKERIIESQAKKIALAHSSEDIATQRKILAGKLVEKEDDANLLAQDSVLSRAQSLQPTEGPQTLDELVQSAYPGARVAREAQDAGYSVARGEAAERGARAFNEAGGGVAGRAAEMQALKGELPKVYLDGVLTNMSPETLGSMYNRLNDAFDSGTLRYFEKVSAGDGLEKFSRGLPPQPSELKLIEKVFGKQTADGLVAPVNLTKMQWLKHHYLDIWNAPRSLQASLDLSAPFRQGLVLGMRHPVVFARNFKPMVKALGSDEYSRYVMRELGERPNADLYAQAKLARTETHGADIGSREEMVPSALTDKIPGIRGSARAYTVFLNKMRADVFDLMIDHAKATGKNYEDPEFLKALGEFLNTTTGRGNLGIKTLENSAELLNSFLFSPRLLASRLQILNPKYYNRLRKADPWLAREAAYASTATLGAISAFLFLASQVAGVSVGLDPRSANFGKIRIRDTRIDVAAGFIPVINLASRLMSGETVSSATGETKELSGEFGESSYLDVLTRFGRSKMAPSPGAILSVLDQRTFTGDPITPKNTLLPLVLPLNFQGGWETGRTENSPAFGAAAYGLGSIGFGVNSYPDKTPGKSKGGRKATQGGYDPYSSGGGSGATSGYDPYTP